MKRLLGLSLALLVVGCNTATSSEERAVSEAGKEKKDEVVVEWLTDFEAAKKEADKRGVAILADFSGSDWCGWCIKLDNEVFARNEFKKYAKKDLVLFLADFPSKKKQTDEVKKQNAALAKEYGVRGFPTVLVLDKEGKVLGRTGYKSGGPEEYVKHIKELVKEGMK